MLHKDTCKSPELNLTTALNSVPDPERVVERSLKVLDLVVGAHVEHDEEDEGADDLGEQVHPQDVDADIPLVDAQLRWPQHDHRPVGIGQCCVDLGRNSI